MHLYLQMQRKPETRREDIMGLFKNDKFAVITRKALVNGSIGLAYRNHGASAGDTGWRFLYDRNEDPLDTANPDKVYAANLARLQEYFPEIRGFLKAKNFTVLENTGGGWREVSRGKDLSDLPANCRLPRKTRFNDGVGTAGITSDPVEMRNLTKPKLAEWETLLPEEVIRRRT